MLSYAIHIALLFPPFFYFPFLSPLFTPSMFSFFPPLPAYLRNTASADFLRAAILNQPVFAIAFCSYAISLYFNVFV